MDVIVTGEQYVGGQRTDRSKVCGEVRKECRGGFGRAINSVQYVWFRTATEFYSE